MPGLVTDWLCIAASGGTIDGRAIDDQWMDDIADTYDPRVFTAMIWPRHDTVENRKYTYNLGTVEAVKLETEDGVKKLYAQLSPNQFLIDANKAGQKLFTSIEIVEKFPTTGRDYLYGLAATDVPASLYTDRMEFNANGEAMTLRTFSAGESMTFTMQDKQQKAPFWERLFSQQPAAKDTEEPMDKAQFEQLLGKLETSDKRMETLEQKLETFSQQQKPAEAAPAPAPTTTQPAPTGEAQPDPNAAPKWFTQYEQGVSTKLDDLTKRFEQIEGKEVTPLPTGTPGDPEDNVWL
ncbi:GPO family capsid scaffolding protein [Serratia proteamaculans]|uniref:GPO family capsid scaffolding protein n=1 Tax=Serratia proteamaculans TaxID=28151 RepID=A0ABS0TVM5_SERPR|nr:GPO family capsid scaffolding protein [Serratia proteamaculans]MBI6182410.1 GPO family capsid scaffolding protein [Serratia proteamaculans]